MDYYNYIVIGLILCGSIIIVLSAILTRKIFNLSTDDQLRNNWKNLTIFMFIFFFGYLGAAYLVTIKEEEILVPLIGVIFFLGALFVFLVVKAGKLSLEKLKSTNETLVEYSLSLESKNKYLEQFSYITSHDLQEPLRNVSSFTDLLKSEYKGKLDGNADKYIEFISDSSDQMSGMVNGLLEYYQIESNVEIGNVNCNTIITDVTNELSEEIKENNIHLQIDTLPEIKAYKKELQALFKNLISNAIKFRQKDIQSFVTISAKKNAANWEFSVRDNGIGIKEEHFVKIFLIFQRLHNKTDYKGTGIGLALCEKIVQLHKGNIWVTSRPKHGSTFYFTIPY